MSYPPPDSSLARRSVSSTAWNMVANLGRLPISLAQSIILARLLPVDYFGIVAGMLAVVNLSAVVFEFGFKEAYLHRVPETEDEGEASAVLFTLRLLFYLIWATLLIGFAFLFLEEVRQLVLIVLTIGGFFEGLARSAHVVLIRRVQHNRLAIVNLTAAVTTFIAAALIAWFTHSIWALLIPSLLMPFWIVMLLYIWRPVWRPRLVWNSAIVKYYLKFGSRAVTGNILGVALDKIDDLWTNIFLGDRALGYYSRAYQFAVYPRIILAVPVNMVTAGTYAELKYDRRRLSIAFRRVNSFLIRTGFLLAGLLAVIAPNFISVFLGERWMPMLDAFRLMLIYTMLDPVKITIASVLIAVGKPERVSLARGIQLFILVLGLLTLGWRYGIAGVALAVDLMLVVGIILLLYFVRIYVDFSFRALFAVPSLALVVGLGMNWLVINWVDQSSSGWLALIVKGIVFSLGYLIVLVAIEGKALFRDVKQIFNLIFHPDSESQNSLKSERN